MPLVQTALTVVYVLTQTVTSTKMILWDSAWRSTLTVMTQTLLSTLVPTTFLMMVSTKIVMALMRLLVVAVALALQAPESDCSDGIDEDQDGLTDCDDSDCASDSACQSSNGCSSTEVLDCIGECTTATWVGDGICDENAPYYDLNSGSLTMTVVTVLGPLAVVLKVTAPTVSMMTKIP